MMMMMIFYLPHYSGRQNIQTRTTTKQTNEQTEKYMNGSDISHIHEQFIT